MLLNGKNDESVAFEVDVGAEVVPDADVPRGAEFRVHFFLYAFGYWLITAVFFFEMRGQELLAKADAIVTQTGFDVLCVKDWPLRVNLRRRTCCFGKAIWDFKIRCGHGG